MIDIYKIYEELKGDNIVLPCGDFEWLYKSVPEGLIWEIGNFRMTSTIALALGNRKVITMDPHEPYRDLVLFDYSDFDAGVKNVSKIEKAFDVKLRDKITIICDYSYKAIPLLKDSPDAIWIDGNHSEKGFLTDLKTIYNSVAKEGILVFCHDCNGNFPGVKNNCDKLDVIHNIGNLAYFELNRELMAKLW